MKRLVIAFLFALAACGGGDVDYPGNPAPAAYDPASDNHGYGYEYDVQTPAGMKLRYTPELSAGHPYTDPRLYDAEFQAAQLCTGISAPPPSFVIIVAGGSLGGHQGMYSSGPSLIRLDVSRNGFFLRHEHVHYLLDYSTGDLDPDHRSPVWGRFCG